MADRTIFAMDPGSENTGYVLWNMDTHLIMGMGWIPNQDLLRSCQENPGAATYTAIEMTEIYGKMLSKDLMATILLIGRMQQIYRIRGLNAITHKQTKLCICGTTAATKSNLKDALEDRYGKPGVKKAPGRLFGITDHTRSALAVAVTLEEIVRGTWSIPNPKPKPDKRRVA